MHSTRCLHSQAPGLPTSDQNIISDQLQSLGWPSAGAPLSHGNLDLVGAAVDGIDADALERARVSTGVGGNKRWKGPESS